MCDANGESWHGWQMLPPRPVPPEAFDPVVNARAAMRYMRARYGWPTFGGERYPQAEAGRLSPMAIAVGAAVVQIYENVGEEGNVRVKNDGPSAAVISKDPAVTASGADGFNVAANAEETVWLRPGEGLYAICAAGQNASVEVI